MNITELHNNGATDLEVVMESLRLLKIQGEQALAPNDADCMYYVTETGNMCGVGILLPDAALYKGVFANVSGLMEDVEDSVLKAALWAYADTLLAIQVFHDNYRAWDSYKTTNYCPKLVKLGVPVDYLAEVYKAIRPAEEA